MQEQNTKPAILHEIAHARAGDKGNHSNICVFAYRPEDYEFLVKTLTEDRVKRHFASRNPTVVTRFLLPNLHGMNFLLENVLDGGVNDALNLDAHGKALSSFLLSLPLTRYP